MLRLGLVWAAAAGLLAPALTAAQTPAPQDVLSMSASASIEVAYDMMSITLSTTREGADAAAVQLQVRQALDAALAEARRAARPGQLEVRTGAFSLSPRLSNKGLLSGWVGQAELVLEGRDMTAIAQLAGRLNTLTVARVGYLLARETRDKAETQATEQAIARFRARATDYAKQFGYAAYTVREVSVGSDSPPPQPMLRSRAMSATAADESLPVEAGKATVSVNVNGSVVMTR
jgi:predicted secreted protein